MVPDAVFFKELEGSYIFHLPFSLWAGSILFLPCALALGYDLDSSTTASIVAILLFTPLFVALLVSFRVTKLKRVHSAFIKCISGVISFDFGLFQSRAKMEKQAVASAAATAKASAAAIDFNLVQYIAH